MWLAGPLSGLVVQPLVGVWSDRCESRFGRRRVFLAAGLLLSLVSMLCFGSSRELGRALGDTDAHKGVAIALAVTSLWLLNIGLNVMQSPGIFVYLIVLVCDRI